MLEVPEIDSIYFEKGKEEGNNGTEINEGIRIYLDSQKGDIDKYYRWGFEETWEFRVPNPKRFFYINESTIIINPDSQDIFRRV